MLCLSNNQGFKLHLSSLHIWYRIKYCVCRRTFSFKRESAEDFESFRKRKIYLIKYSYLIITFSESSTGDIQVIKMKGLTHHPSISFSNNAEETTVKRISSLINDYVARDKPVWIGKNDKCITKTNDLIIVKNLVEYLSPRALLLWKHNECFFFMS
jgi:hypothetical protein